MPPVCPLLFAAISEEDLFDAVSEEEARASAALREAVGSGNADYGSKVRWGLPVLGGPVWRHTCADRDQRRCKQVWQLQELTPAKTHTAAGVGAAG